MRNWDENQGAGDSEFSLLLCAYFLGGHCNIETNRNGMLSQNIVSHVCGLEHLSKFENGIGKPH